MGGSGQLTGHRRSGMIDTMTGPTPPQFNAQGILDLLTQRGVSLSSTAISEAFGGNDGTFPTPKDAFQKCRYLESNALLIRETDSENYGDMVWRLP